MSFITRQHNDTSLPLRSAQAIHRHSSAYETTNRGNPDYIPTLDLIPDDPRQISMRISDQS